MTGTIGSDHCFGDACVLVDQLERQTSITGVTSCGLRVCRLPVKLILVPIEVFRHHHEADGLDDSFDSEHFGGTHHYFSLLEFDFHLWRMEVRRLAAGYRNGRFFYLVYDLSCMVWNCLLHSLQAFRFYPAGGHLLR